MSASMRNFMEAYEAVHNKEVRDEFYKNQDELSSMNIGRLTDNDLREISEQICEHLFSEGASVSDAELIISELFSESEIVGRQKKAERILDAFAEAFKKIKSKSTDVALESFARYRNNKKLQETWSVRFNQEKRVQRAHGTSVADEVAAVKSGLLSMIEGKMPEGLRKYMEKKGKGHSKDEDKSDSKSGGKPDFLDLDKDGDKKESMKKAAKDKKMSEGMHAPKMQKGAMAYDGPNKAASEAKDRVMQKSKVAKMRMAGNLGRQMASSGMNSPAGQKAMKKSNEITKQLNKEDMKLGENRMAAYTAGGYKDDSKKQTDPSKPGFTGISGSIKDIMRQNKEIEAKNKAAKAKQGMKEQLESTGKFTAKEIESIIEKL